MVKKSSIVWALMLVAAICHSQSVINPPICYGDPIQLYNSFFVGGASVIGGTFHWTNASGSWASDLQDPVIEVDSTGYNSDKFYLQVQYPDPPGSFSGGRVTVVVWTKITTTGTVTPISCYGNTNGAISISTIGGSPAYSYLWNDGVTTKNRTGLTDGTYTVVVTDQRNCHNTSIGSPYSCGIYVYNPGASFAVTPPPAPLSISGTAIGVSCSGAIAGSITILVSGGTSPYSYLWSNSSTTSDITGLSIGAYTVTVTDANDCQAMSSYEILATDDFILHESHNDTNCGLPSGHIAITPSCRGNTYSYLWNDGTITQNRMGLAAGTYTVTATSSNNAHAHKTITIQ